MFGLIGIKTDVFCKREVWLLVKHCESMKCDDLGVARCFDRKLLVWKINSQNALHKMIKLIGKNNNHNCQHSII